MVERVIMSHSSIRLSSYEIEAIRSCFRAYFQAEDHLWLFGSRTNPNARGGDIDFYIETTISSATIANEARASFLFDLYHKIGDQKIDVVLNILSDAIELAIYKIAKKEGVQLE